MEELINCAIASFRPGRQPFKCRQAATTYTLSELLMENKHIAMCRPRCCANNEHTAAAAMSVGKHQGVSVPMSTQHAIKQIDS